MRKIKFVFTELVLWFWRGWPILAIVAVISFHVFLLWYLSEQAESINESFSIASQIIGGLLVLYSIDSIVLIIKNKNLFGLLRDYCSDFPIFKEKADLRISSVTQVQGVGDVNVNGSRVPESLEEKILNLQKQIDETNFNLDKEIKRIDKIIEIESSKFTDRMKHLKNITISIEQKTDQAFVGGIKIQLFGVFLIIYGAISGPGYVSCALDVTRNWFN